MKLCLRCHGRSASRPRGLCWSCYYRSGQREQYEKLGRRTDRGVADRNGRRPLPPTATDAAPGSEAKIIVLMERASRHEALWHPDDLVEQAPTFLLASSLRDGEKPRAIKTRD